MYVSCLLQGLAEIDEAGQNNAEWNEKSLEICNLAQSESAQKQMMYELLEKVDPESAKKISPSDLVRIERALSVFYQTGKPISYFYNKQKGGLSEEYSVLVIVLLPDREKLYQRINQRSIRCLRMGLLRRGKHLETIYTCQTRVFDSIGYRHVRDYLRGGLDYDFMVELLKRDTRRFAKRQLTWWRNQPSKYGWNRLDQSEELSRQFVFSLCDSSLCSSSERKSFDNRSLEVEPRAGEFEGDLCVKELADYYLSNRLPAECGYSIGVCSKCELN